MNFVNFITSTYKQFSCLFCIGYVRAWKFAEVEPYHKSPKQEVRCRHIVCRNFVILGILALFSSQFNFYKKQILLFPNFSDDTLVKGIYYMLCAASYTLVFWQKGILCPIAQFENFNLDIKQGQKICHIIQYCQYILHFFIALRWAPVSLLCPHIKPHSHLYWKWNMIRDQPGPAGIPKYHP